MIALLLSSLAFADIPEYTFLEVGEPAPFSGRLFNDEASQLIADEIANATDKCQIQIDYHVGIANTIKQHEVDMLKSEMKFEKQFMNAKIKFLETRVASLEELKTPPRRGFWFTVGLVSGVGVTIAIAKAVQ
jgi:hypothetical protein